MAKKKILQTDEDIGHHNKRITPEARESQLIALAYDLVEKRLREGTATSQETTHFLKLGSSRERREKKLEENQIELMQAKIDALQSAKRMESLYEDAINAVRSYSSPVTRETITDDD